MKLQRIASWDLLAIMVVMVGYGIALTRRGLPAPTQFYGQCTIAKGGTLGGK